MPSWLSSLSGFPAVTAEVPAVLYTLYTVHCTTAAMEGNLVGYKIPRLSKDALLINDIEPLPDWRIQQRKQFSQVFASRCAHCRDFHLPTSYCFQIRFLTDRMGKRKRDSDPDSNSESEEGQLSGSDSREEYSGGEDVSDEGSGDESDHLKDFYSKVERIDQKEVTLSLSKRTEKLYFSTVLGRGKFDREGREKIRDKYYLGPKQFSKFNPPDLMDTKLHIVESMDFSGLSNKLQILHGKFRDVVKVELKHFEALAVSEVALKRYEPVEVYDNIKQEATEDWCLPDLKSYLTSAGDVDDSDPELHYSESNFDKMKRELAAYKRKDSDAVKLYRKVLDKLEDADKAAREGMQLQKLSSELVWDQLQLSGQADVFLRFGVCFTFCFD